MSKICVTAHNANSTFSFLDGGYSYLAQCLLWCVDYKQRFQITNMRLE